MWVGEFVFQNQCVYLRVLPTGAVWRDLQPVLSRVSVGPLSAWLGQNYNARPAAAVSQFFFSWASYPGRGCNASPSRKCFKEDGGCGEGSCGIRSARWARASGGFQNFARGFNQGRGWRAPLVWRGGGILLSRALDTLTYASGWWP